MDDSNHQDNIPNRFSMQNPAVETQRIMFDVFDLPTGALFDPPGLDSDGDDIQEIEARTLFADESPDPLSNQHSEPTNTNNVTLTSYCWRSNR